MAGKKDKAMVVVIGGLTDNQAAEMTKEIQKAKRRYAPNARATMGVTQREEIGKLIQKGQKKCIGVK